jgi:hypothetical protein
LGSVPGQDLTFTAATTPPAKEPVKEPPAQEPPPPASTGGDPAGATAGPPPSGQPKAGPLFGSVELASAQRGGMVRGSLVVSSAGSGGRLQIELLAKGAAAPVGRLVRSSLRMGKLSFALRLNGGGKATLRRDGRLALAVKIVLTPAQGTATTVTRAITVRT